MKKSPSSSKLQLRKQTVRVMVGSELGQVAGGTSGQCASFVRKPTIPLTSTSWSVVTSGLTGD